MQYLVERAIDRPQPIQDDIDQIHEKQYNEQYRTDIGAVVDYASAVSLMNRYCDILPSDHFTQPTVTWRRVRKPNGKYVVCILLPIQSPISYEIFVSTCKVVYKSMQLMGLSLIREKKCPL